MKNNNYTLKEILFGLRKEYLKLSEQLNSLKKYISLDDIDMESTEFFLTKPTDTENIAIMCILQRRKKDIEKIIIELETSSNNKKTSIKKIEGIHTLKKYPELIGSSNLKEFNENVYNICNEDFVRNMQDIYNGIEPNNKLFLSINSNHIYASENSKLSIDYTPHLGDFIHIYNFRNTIKKQDIEKILNLSFPKDRFPEYYKTLIENFYYSDKTIDIIGEFNNSPSTDLEITETSKKILLRKK